MPTDADPRLIEFVQESLEIEGIDRGPTLEELRVAAEFLGGPLTLTTVCRLQTVFAPYRPLRTNDGMNVQVGNYVAPAGGPEIVKQLTAILAQAGPWPTAWSQHVAFESLHPFMDGNGRVGRLVWAWTMLREGRDPFALSFLHRFYYQTLRYAGGREVLECSI